MGGWKSARADAGDGRLHLGEGLALVGAAVVADAFGEDRFELLDLGQRRLPGSVGAIGERAIDRLERALEDSAFDGCPGDRCV